MEFKNRYIQVISGLDSLTLQEIISYCDDLFELNCSSNDIDSNSIPARRRSFNIMCDGKDLQEGVRYLFNDFITDDDDTFEAFIPSSGKYTYVGGCDIDYSSGSRITFGCEIEDEEDKPQFNNGTSLSVTNIKSISLQEIIACSNAIFDLGCSINQIKGVVAIIPCTERIFRIECSEDLHEEISSIFQRILDEQFDKIKKIIPPGYKSILTKSEYATTGIYLEGVGMFIVMKEYLDTPKSLKIHCDIK